MLNGIQKVVEAPTGSQIKILPPIIRQSEEHEAIPIRIVDDPSAPAYYREVITTNPNQTHAYRRNDVVAELRKQLIDKAVISFYDVYAIRKAFNIDEKPEFFFRPKFGSPQYSSEFIKWIMSRHEEDNEFFAKTRALLKKKK